MDTSIFPIGSQTPGIFYNNDPLTPEFVHKEIMTVCRKILSGRNLTQTQREYIEECNELSKSFLNLRPKITVNIPNVKLQVLENYLSCKNFEEAIIYANNLLESHLTGSEALFVNRAKQRAIGHLAIASANAHYCKGDKEFALTVLNQFLAAYPDITSIKEYSEKILSSDT